MRESFAGYGGFSSIIRPCSAILPVGISRDSFPPLGTLTLCFSRSRKALSPVGYFKAENMEQVVDCNAHAVFFDRKPAEKVQLGKLVTKWMFDNYPLRRISADIPDIYVHTLRFALALGFKHEGIRRKAVA